MKKYYLLIGLLGMAGSLWAQVVSVQTPNTSLVLSAPQGGALKHLYYGTKLSDSDLKNSMFSSEWQRLEQLIPEEDSIDVLEALMGKNVEPRKKFVFNNIDFGEFVYG